MTENTTTVVENVEGQIDLFTGEVVEETVEETEEWGIGEIVDHLVNGFEEEITAYKLATLINKVFEITGNEKRIPTQMMYNYTLKGMIVKGKKGSAKEIRYTKDEVKEYTIKFVNKHTN